MGAVPVAGAGAPVEPNPNPPVVPPNGALVSPVVVPPEPPNANGLAVGAAVGAVVVEPPPPNANGFAVVVAGFVDDPKLNIFLNQFNRKKKRKTIKFSKGITRFQ